jgi:group I intron endonuclease
MGYIYLITNKLDNKKYVGQTLENDIYERWKGHFKKGSNCTYLKRALQKYGKDNFRFQIICICFDSDCDKYEKEYMEKYNVLVPNGYNLREAGNNGKQNEETKKKIADSVRLYYSNLSDEQKKEYSRKRSGANNPCFGKKRTKEQCKNIKNKKRVKCYNLHNELIDTFDSMSEAGRKFNIDYNNISKCCKGKHKTCGGFIWKFSE